MAQAQSATYKKMRSACHASRYPWDKVDKLLKDELVLDAFGSVFDEGAKISLGREYHTASNNVKRCLEEKEYLKQERERLNVWIDHISRLCQELKDEAYGSHPFSSLCIDAGQSVVQQAQSIVHAFACIGLGEHTGKALHLERHYIMLSAMRREMDAFLADPSFDM